MDSYKYKCHGCDATLKIDHQIKEFVCEDCGCVNVTMTTDLESDDAASCIPPTSFEWKLPAGQIGSPVSGYLYVTAQGSQLTKAEYIEAFGIDPEVALNYMRTHKAPPGFMKVGGGKK